MYDFPKLQNLPDTIPEGGVIKIQLGNGVPIFQASTAVQEQINSLLQKQQTDNLTLIEIEELNRYEHLDDYLSHLNRVVRDLSQPSGQSYFAEQNPGR